MQRLEQAISTSTVVKSCRALLSLKNGNVEDAFKLAKESTLLQPKEGFGWSVLSQIQLAQGNKADALTSIKTALELLPYHHKMHNRLAQVYEAMGQQAEAKAAREKSISLRDKYESGITKAIREQPMLLSDTDSGVAFDTLLAMDKNLS
jgi:predicted Zn-dependent protease